MTVCIVLQHTLQLHRSYRSRKLVFASLWAAALKFMAGCDCIIHHNNERCDTVVVQCIFDNKLHADGKKHLAAVMKSNDRDITSNERDICSMRQQSLCFGIPYLCLLKAHQISHDINGLNQHDSPVSK